MSLTQGQILNSVSTLYKQYGIKSITMDDTSRHLGISKKTLYNYVENKTDLVTQILVHERKNLKDDLSRIMANALNAVDVFYNSLLFVVRFSQSYNKATLYDLNKYYGELFSTHNENIKAILFEFSKNTIVHGQHEKIFRTNFDTNINARLFANLFESILTKDVDNIFDIHNTQNISEVFSFYIHGIANEKGLEIFNKITSKKNSYEIS